MARSGRTFSEAKSDTVTVVYNRDGENDGNNGTSRGVPTLHRSMLGRVLHTLNKATLASQRWILCC